MDDGQGATMPGPDALQERRTAGPADTERSGCQSIIFPNKVLSSPFILIYFFKADEWLVLRFSLKETESS